MNESKSDSTSAPGTPGGAVPDRDERTWGMLAHLSAFSGLIVPFAGSVIGPLVIWLAKRDQSAFVGEQAREALNFNILVLLGWLVCGVLTMVFVGFLLGVVLLIYWIVVTITAGIKAGEGVHYRYAVSVRFVK
ncbi:MAG: DUF4870 domain-containing protein [Steroidobacteraceae bacterium]